MQRPEGQSQHPGSFPGRGLGNGVFTLEEKVTKTEEGQQVGQDQVILTEAW